MGAVIYSGVNQGPSIPVIVFPFDAVPTLTLCRYNLCKPLEIIQKEAVGFSLLRTFQIELRTLAPRLQILTSVLIC